MNTDSDFAHDRSAKQGDGLAERINELEKKMADLSTRGKDGWDKAQILAAFLVPVAIAFAGYVFSRSTKQAEIKIAETNARVAQAELVHSFTDSLTSPEPEKRKIAIAAVLLALPDDGTRLVETVKQFDPDAGVRAYASQRLGASDLYAQVVFDFDSYGEGAGIPPNQVFAESAQLEIHLKARDSQAVVFDAWQNSPVLKQPDVTLTTQHQTVDRQRHVTVDGTSLTQTNTFDRFQGDIGKFSDPNAWKDAKIEAFFRATPLDPWLFKLRSRVAPSITEDFDRLYSVTAEQRQMWADSDYQVTPLLPVKLEVFLGTTRVAAISGIIAYVWEHDEDARNLHVARFVKE